MNLRIARKLWSRMYVESKSDRGVRMYLGRRAIVRLCSGRSTVTRDAFGMTLDEIKKSWNEKQEMPW